MGAPATLTPSRSVDQSDGLFIVKVVQGEKFKVGWGLAGRSVMMNDR